MRRQGRSGGIAGRSLRRGQGLACAYGSLGPWNMGQRDSVCDVARSHPKGRRSCQRACGDKCDYCFSMTHICQETIKEAFKRGIKIPLLLPTRPKLLGVFQHSYHAYGWIPLDALFRPSPDQITPELLVDGEHILPSRRIPGRYGVEARATVGDEDPVRVERVTSNARLSRKQST
jgi:hypothetical protein